MNSVKSLLWPYRHKLKLVSSYCNSFNSSLLTKKLNTCVPGAQIRDVSNMQSNTKPIAKTEELEVTFIKASGEKISAKCKEGDTILDVVVNNSIDLEGYGACEGTLTCSTCHLILKKEDYNRLPNKPTDEELDMLDLASDLTDTSRLGCQITMTKDLSGLEVNVPATISDARN